MSVRARTLMLLALCLLPTMIGCRKKEEPKPPVAAAPVKPPPPSDALLKQNKVNEVGLIPILEYHDVMGERNTAMIRSVASFKKDLERLYNLGYRPITMKAFLDNRIDVPLGKSPCVLTFDDSRGSQFKTLPDGSVDPNCAVGIMQDFEKQHPDFPVRATFYVLPSRVFDQPSLKAEKLEALLKMGCEIGNHTVKHPNLKRLSDAKVQEEIGMNIKLLQEMVPNVRIETLAVPMGVLPRNKKLLAAGETNGFKYTNRAALLAGANPARSPVHVKFDPWRIPRILVQDVPMGSNYWLDDLKAKPEMRYISDGDPDTVSVPRLHEKQVNRQRLNGAQLRLYGTP